MSSRKVIDLRTDTSSLPTKEMLEAILTAPLGNDGFGEDPTVNALQDLACRKLGKESSLFVSSGTQGNLIGLLSNSTPGQYLIAEKDSHILEGETDAYAKVAGLSPIPLEGVDGAIDPIRIRTVISETKEKEGQIAMVSLENTHNMAGGTIVPPENLKAIREVVEPLGIPIHLDGSRIFNAAVASGVDVKTLAKDADTLTFCLSKGLCAPAGSIILGDSAFISRARKMRRLLGGEMRQAGVLAAPGIVALNTMVDRLKEDHANARFFAKSLHDFGCFDVDLRKVQTNIVWFDLSGNIDPLTFVRELEKLGVKIYHYDGKRFRVAFYKDILFEDAVYALQCIEKIVGPIKADDQQGFPLPP